MKKKIRAVYIIDASGSMGGQRTQTIEGFQQDILNLVEEEKKFGNIEYWVTVVTFNVKYQVVADNVRLTDLLDFDFGAVYAPMGGTALNQTVGEVLEKIDPNEKNVLVTIMTDGEETSSVGEYANVSTLKSLITDCEKRKWAFIFLGANLDTQGEARSRGVSNFMSFDASDMSQAYTANRNSRVSYTCSVSNPEQFGASASNLTRGVTDAKSLKKKSLDDLILENVAYNQTVNDTTTNT